MSDDHIMGITEKQDEVEFEQRMAELDTEIEQYEENAKRISRIINVVFVAGAVILIWTRYFLWID